MCDNIYDKLYSIFYSVNKEILSRDTSDDLNFLDFYLFQSTSFAISIIRNNYFNDVKSISRCFSNRCLIESIALIKMYDSKKLNIDIHLLREYNNIVEYQMYSKYKNDFGGILFNSNELEETYKKIIDKYKNNKKYKNDKEVKAFLKKKIPFVENSFSFDNIVKEYFNDVYDYYHVLSVIIHPSDLNIVCKYINSLDLYALENRLFNELLDEIIKNKYLNNESLNYNLVNEKRMIVLNPNNIKYMSLVNEQTHIYNDVCDILEKINKKSSVLSLLFDELSKFCFSFAIDHLLGFNEINKCKFKTIIEHLSLVFYFEKAFLDTKINYKYTLFKNYTYIKLLQATNEEDKSDEYYNEAYDIYIKNIKKIDKDKFKAIFNKTMGFIEEGKTITDLVNDLIDGLIIDDKLNKLTKITYDESQKLSHSNGYMLISNNGAFNDFIFTEYILDIIIRKLLDHYIVILLGVSLSEKQSINNTIEELKDNNNKLKKIIEDKQKFNIELSKITNQDILNFQI